MAKSGLLPCAWYGTDPEGHLAASTGTECGCLPHRIVDRQNHVASVLWCWLPVWIHVQSEVLVISYNKVLIGLGTQCSPRQPNTMTLIRLWHLHRCNSVDFSGIISDLHQNEWDEISHIISFHSCCNWQGPCNSPCPQLMLPRLEEVLLSRRCSCQQFIRAWISPHLGCITRNLSDLAFLWKWLLDLPGISPESLLKIWFLFDQPPMPLSPTPGFRKSLIDNWRLLSLCSLFWINAVLLM